MSDKGVFLMVFLTMSGLQCGQSEAPAPVSVHHSQQQASSPKDTVRLPDETCKLVGIKVEKAEVRQCRSTLRAMGKILAPQPRTAIVSHAFPARVAQVHVQIGDLVKKGDIVVTLESHEVGKAKSEYYKAVADSELAKVNLERQKRLVEQEIGAKKNLLVAEAGYKVAMANVEAAEKTLHVFDATEEQLTEIASTHQVNPTISLHAPIAGKVVDIKAVLGAMVDQSTELLRIIDTRSLWGDAEIYEKDIAKIKIGQKADVSVLAYPGVTFEGIVSYIGDLVNEQTCTITVRTEVANSEYLLKPGMFAEITILLNESSQTVVVPHAAVLEEGNRRTLFVKEEDSFVCREVQTGVLVEGDYQQVLKGLKAGEEVVIEGNHELKSKLMEETLNAAHVH